MRMMVGDMFVCMSVRDVYSLHLLSPNDPLICTKVYNQGIMFCIFLFGCDIAYM